jgi:hypothetical protein
MTTPNDPRLYVVIYRDITNQENPERYVLACRYMFHTQEGAFRMAAAASRTHPKKRAPLVVSALESTWEDIRRDNPSCVAVEHEAPGGEGHARLLGWGCHEDARRYVYGSRDRKLVIATGPQGWRKLVDIAARDPKLLFDDGGAFAPLEAAP